jgi:hypothetical protein
LAQTLLLTRARRFFQRACDHKSTEDCDNTTNTTNTNTTTILLLPLSAARRAPPHMHAHHTSLHTGTLALSHPHIFAFTEFSCK